MTRSEHTTASAISAVLSRSGLRCVATRTQEGVHVWGSTRIGAVSIVAQYDDCGLAERIALHVFEHLLGLGYNVRRDDNIVWVMPRSMPLPGPAL